MATDTDRHVKNVVVKPWKYWSLLGAYGTLFVLCILGRWFTGGFLAKFGIYNADWITLVLIALFATRWRSVPENFIAGITVFNQPAIEFGGGYYLILPGSKLGMLPLSSQNDQFPADPEFISKRPDTDPLMPGEVRPIRIMTGPADPEDEDEVLGERTAPEFTFSVRWHVYEKGYFELAINLPGGTDWDNKLYQVRKNMRDTGEGFLNLEVSTRSPVKVVREQKQIGEGLKARIQEAFERYDLVIEEVLLQSPDFGRGINKALARVNEARAESKIARTVSEGQRAATINAAEAEKERQRLVSEGQRVAAVNIAEGEKERLRLTSEGQKQADINAAAARVITLAAEGEGRSKAADSLDMTGSEYVAMEQAPKILGDKTVVINGITEALGIGATALAAAAKQKPAKGGKAK